MGVCVVVMLSDVPPALFSDIYAPVLVSELKTCLNSCYWNCTLSWNLNRHGTTCIPSLFSWPCQRLRAASKREWDLCWRFFRPSIFIFPSFVSNVPLTFFLLKKDAREQGWKEKHLQWRWMGCKVRRALQWWWWGVLLHCESLLSNGVFSHQHRPHWVCSAREYWERKGGRGTERGKKVGESEREMVVGGGALNGSIGQPIPCICFNISRLFIYLLVR